MTKGIDFGLVPGGGRLYLEMRNFVVGKKVAQSTHTYLTIPFSCVAFFEL